MVRSFVHSENLVLTSSQPYVLMIIVNEREVISMTDVFVVGTKEFDKINNELFNNYFPTFLMELEESDNCSEVYRINNIHKVLVLYREGKPYQIEVTREYFYYN